MESSSTKLLDRLRAGRVHGDGQALDQDGRGEEGGDEDGEGRGHEQAREPGGARVDAARPPERELHEEEGRVGRRVERRDAQGRAEERVQPGEGRSGGGAANAE